MPSSTVVAGHLAIRPCFINPRTRLADVDALVDHVTTIGDQLTGVPSG
jgi:aromatic-L-amino-acid/L-tryptophan decarboxylase